MTGSSQRAVRAAERTTSPRIVVADDDPCMRDLLVAVFRRCGYDVVSVPDGSALIERLRDGSAPPPDVIITDVIMPGVDGFGVLREVERLPVPPAVILITAFGDPITHRRAREHGAAEVVDKPFDIDALRKLVERIVGR